MIDTSLDVGLVELHTTVVEVVLFGGEVVDLSNVPPVGTGAKFGMTAAGLLCLLLVYLTIEQLLTKEASVGIMVGRILFATFAAAASVTLWIQLMRLRRRFPKTLAMKEFFQ